MRWFALVTSSSLLMLAMFSSGPRPASAAGIAGFDSCGVNGAEPPQITTVNFHRYKVPAGVSLLARRDLEFLWSDSYTLFGTPLHTAYRSPSTDTELDLLGLTTCSTPGTGVFGFPVPFIELIYNYLRAPIYNRPSVVDNYNPFPDDTLGFAIVTPPPTVYPNVDRNHADTYLFAPPFTGDPVGGNHPGDGASARGSWPSAFVDASEDSSTGSPDPNVFHRNSIHIPGPKPSQVGVGGTNDWTRPGGLASFVFNHEFQHMINYAQPGPPISEIFSHAAEALTGVDPDGPVNDVAYTWGLLRPGLNYQAYRSFSAYLTYNFRGVDTTFAGRGDDLIWRWARANDRSLVSGLGQQLTNANCLECANKSYFNGLSDTARVNLLIHNWRVANYVNKPSLAEGQYGFPPQFGFEPNFDVGNWQNIKPEDADTVNIEMEVKLNSSHLTRELSLAGKPTAEVLNPGNAHAMALARFGSEYWVVRSDPSLWGANRDLVIRVMPEGFCPSRLTASAIAYSQQDLPGGQPDSLWNHAEWAQLAIAPKWINVATGVDPDPIELVVPNFGQTYKAALVVITAGASTDAMDDTYVLPYRLNLTLRVAPFQSPNPTQVTTFTAASPYSGWTSTWSPAGDQVAFVRTDTTSAYDQIYRVPVSGGTPTILFPQQSNQFYPDWSPRGDWVSLDQAAGAGCDVWVVSPFDGQSRRLTSTTDHEYAAVFSPNGQQLVYLREVPGPPGAARIQLRRVNVDGGNDTLLWDRTANVTVQPPRWAPNGPRVYLAVSGNGDSLYAIDAVGPQRGTVTAIARLQLPPGGTHFHFDPPRGTGRWVWEVGWQPPGCGAPSSPPRRLALRDSPTDPSDETVFCRPTSIFTRPRWSWDGTRIAYNVSQPPLRANVFVAQVSYNHAPSFVGLSDQTLSAGQPFELEVTAIDPDGESLTYEAPAVFLPPGASFDPTTRRFTWPNPPLPGTVFYFVVFRALDPSGAVAHRVIRLEVQGPGGGCPFLDSRTAAGWQEENSVLGRSLTDALSLDGYRLKHSPHVVNGRVSVRVRENEQEHSVLDHVRMVAVDHAPDVRAYSIGDRVFLGTRVPAFRVTTSDGRDITALVSGSDGHYLGFPGDTLRVEMSAPRGVGTFGANAAQEEVGGEGGMEGDPGEMEKEYRAPDILARRASPMSGSAIDADVLAYTGIVVQVPDGAQGWRTLTHYYPRRYRWETVLDSLGTGPCRLIFVGRHRLSFIGRYLRAATPATPQALTLLTAQHSRLGDRKAAANQSGGAITTLAPGDTLTLEFATTAVPAGQMRDHFLFTTGVYSAIAPPAQGREGGWETAPRPTRFALAQNQPNPFERTTTIRFELPRETTVRLEVFDLMGRRIAVLAEGPLPAGYHAADWDRRDVRGILAPPGVYLYRLTAGDFRETRKLLLSR